MNNFKFDAAFEKLTGTGPFPWQCELCRRFVADRPDNIPASCNLPTGLGKTSVVAIWLISLASRPDRMPRLI
jgi:CRISPR-associated endonuclease/helicase Cas3